MLAAPLPLDMCFLATTPPAIRYERVERVGYALPGRRRDFGWEVRLPAELGCATRLPAQLLCR